MELMIGSNKTIAMSKILSSPLLCECSWRKVPVICKGKMKNVNLKDDKHKQVISGVYIIENKNEFKFIINDLHLIIPQCRFGLHQNLILGGLHIY